MVDLNGVKLRNRVVTAASLTGYGATPPGQALPFGTSPIAAALPLARMGAVVSRTVTVAPREGHFTTRTDWKLPEWPGLVRRYRDVLRRIDGGWLNAFGWANIGIEAYLRDYFPRTGAQNRIVSVGGFSAEEFTRLVDVLNERVAPGEIAGVELNVSCHNVNFPFHEIVADVLDVVCARSRHPLLLKLSPDDDYVTIARLAQERGIAALTAINTVKGLRLDPETGAPLLKNRFGGMSGRAIKPIALRVVAELRDAGVHLPIVATGGIRTFDDAREFFWAGADAVSVGSEAFLAPYPGYALAPLRAGRVLRLVRQVERYEAELSGRRERAASLVATANGKVAHR